jgi:hypothetical protein
MWGLRKRPRLDEVRRILWRVIDLSTPHLLSLASGGGSRSSHRYNRTLPVLFVPCPHRLPDIEGAMSGITKDISDAGMSLILPGRCAARHAVVGMWYASREVPPENSEPVFLSGLVRRSTNIGGGFWQAGIELTDVFDDDIHVQRLRPRAVALVPPHLWTEAQISANARAVAELRWDGRTVGR